MWVLVIILEILIFLISAYQRTLFFRTLKKLAWYYAVFVNVDGSFNHFLHQSKFFIISKFFLVYSVFKKIKYNFISRLIPIFLNISIYYNFFIYHILFTDSTKKIQ